MMKEADFGFERKEVLGFKKGKKAKCSFTSFCDE